MFYCQISISLRFDSEQENQNGGIKMSKNIVSVYDTITQRYVEIEVSEKIRTTSKEEWYKILNAKSCIAVWMNFLRMNEGWSLQYILKIKRKTRSLVFYIPLSKTLTKRNVGFCASLTNFWNRNKKRLLNTRLLPLYKCKENKSSK